VEILVDPAVKCASVSCVRRSIPVTSYLCGPATSGMGHTRLLRLRRRHSRISFDSRLGRSRNGFGLGVTLLIEAPGRCTFIPSLQSSIFQIGEPFVLYSDALWRALTLFYADPPGSCRGR